MIYSVPRKFNKLQIIAAALLVPLLAVMTLPVYAKTTRAAAYSVPLSDKTSLHPETGDGDTVRFLDMTADWDFLRDAAHVKRYMEDGFCTACAVVDTDDSAGETVFTLELSDDFSEYNALCFGVETTFASNSPSATYAEIRMTDYSGNRVVGGTYLQMSDIDGNTYTDLVCLDISDFAGRDDAATLTVTMSYDADSAPDIIRITNPYVEKSDNGGFSYAKRYLTNSLVAADGVFGMKSGAIRPNERGRAVLSGAFVLSEQPKIGSDAFLEVRLSHIVSGSLTAIVSLESGEETEISKIALVPDDDGHTSVILPFTVSEALLSFELDFDGVTCDGYFKLEEIILHSTDGGSFEKYPDLGRVDEITGDGNTVTFSGEMEREAVREYGNGALCFYAIPGWTGGSVGNAVEIGRTKVSTRFDFTVDLSDYAGISDAYMFFAAVRTDDGNILPLSSPAYPTAVEISEKTLSNVGLYGAAAVGVFESNASHVIVDVSLDRLLDASGEGDTPLSVSYAVYTPAFRRIGEDGAIQRAEHPSEGTAADGTEVTVIETSVCLTSVSLDFLRELDSEINFYISAGLEVYLRLSLDNVVTSLTYSSLTDLTAFADGAEHYAVMPDTADGRYLYTALVRLLCRRYNGIAGFVMGYSANDGCQTGDTGELEIAEYAKRLAEMCRLTYNAAYSEISDILVILPMSDGEVDTGFRNIDPVILNALLSMYLERIGSIPWAIMYVTDEMSDIIGVSELDILSLDEAVNLSDKNGTVSRLSRMTDDLGLNGSAATFYYYEPTRERVTAGFENSGDCETYSEYLAKMFARLCESTRAGAVFLSLEGQGDNFDHEFYSHLKKIESSPNSGGGRRSVSDYSAISSEAAEEILSNMRSVTSIWNFENQFYPLGWIAGGGVESCLTMYSDLFGDTEDGRYSRVLRSVVTLEKSSGSGSSEGTAAGIVLRNLSRPVNLSDVELLTFTIALNHPGRIIGTGDEGGTVVFIIGSDDCRAEFTAENVPYGQVQTYVCDLTEYAFSDKIDYMGILVYGNHETYLDLSCVNACSGTLTHDELEEIFSSPEEEAMTGDRSAVILVSGIVFAVSVSAAILLIRHDTEERRERESAVGKSRRGDRMRR